MLFSCLLFYFSPYTAQHSVSLGPPPFKTRVKPCCSKYSLANCPRPPPPQCVIIGVSLSILFVGSGILFVFRSQTRFCAQGRTRTPPLPGEDGNGATAKLFWSPGSTEASLLRVSITSSLSRACSTNSRSSSGDATPAFREDMKCTVVLLLLLLLLLNNNRPGRAVFNLLKDNKFVELKMALRDSI